MDDEICRICSSKKRTRCSYTCEDEACKITNRLFVWKVKVPFGSQPPMGATMGSGGGWNFYRNSKERYSWAHFNHKRKTILERLNQVRARLFILEKINSIEGIEKAIDVNYCNQIKIKHITLNTHNYEQQRATFNTF